MSKDESVLDEVKFTVLGNKGTDHDFCQPVKVY